MKKCQYCGSENEDTGRFCLNCGAELPQESVAPAQPVVPAQPVAAAQPAAPAQPVAPAQPAASQPVQSYQQPVQPVSQAPQYTTAAPSASYQSAEPKTNGLCTAGFVVSLLSLFCCGITAIIGLILSICGAVSAGKKGQKGKGLAIAGIIISAILMVGGGIFFLMGGAAWMESFSDYYDMAGTEKTKDNDDEDVDIKEAITSRNWVETHSNSYLVFGSGKKFTYYRDYNTTDDYYYTGKYEIYVGEDAMEYITDDLSEYGITEDEIEDMIDANRNYDLSNLVCIVLKNNEQIIGGVNTLSDTVVTPYCGFYIGEDEDATLDLTNLNAASNFTFITEDNYEPVDTSYTTAESSDYTVATDTTAATTAETTASSGSLTVMGDSTMGRVALTQGSWSTWYEAGGYSSIVTSHDAAFNTQTGSIINIQVWDTDITPENAAQSSMYNMESNQYTGVTGAHVTIGGNAAIQTYGVAPDGQYLVCWFFRSDDDVFHYISVEFTTDDYASFQMVEDNYTLN